MLFVFRVHSVRLGTYNRYILKPILCNNDITNDSKFYEAVYVWYWSKTAFESLWIENWNERRKYIIEIIECICKIKPDKERDEIHK